MIRKLVHSRVRSISNFSALHASDRTEKRSAFRRKPMLDSVIPGEAPGSMGARYIKRDPAPDICFENFGVASISASHFPGGRGWRWPRLAEGGALFRPVHVTKPTLLFKDPNFL